MKLAEESMPLTLLLVQDHSAQRDAMQRRFEESWSDLVVIVAGITRRLQSMRLFWISTSRTAAAW
jgi:hypothetical protein